MGDHLVELGNQIEEAQHEWDLAMASMVASTAIGIGLSFVTFGVSDAVAEGAATAALAGMEAVCAALDVALDAGRAGAHRPHPRRRPAGGEVHLAVRHRRGVPGDRELRPRQEPRQRGLAPGGGVPRGSMVIPTARNGPHQAASRRPEEMEGLRERLRGM